MLTHRVTIFEVPHEALGRTLVLSVITHVLLGFFSLFSARYRQFHQGAMGRCERWGGGAISVGMVQNIRGLNLPQPEMTTQTKIASESKGLGQTEPAKTEVKEPEVPDPKAFEVQEKKKEPKRQERPAQKAPPQIAQNVPPKEVVPFGEGGTPGFTYSQFSGCRRFRWHWSGRWHVWIEVWLVREADSRHCQRQLAAQHGRRQRTFGAPRLHLF